VTSSDEVVNPVDVETNIRRLANDVGRGVRVRSEALAKYRAAERSYEHAFAVEYMKYSGPANSKRYAAEIATQVEREARDAAEVVWKYAENQGRALELELSAWQSIARSVNGMYGAAGR